MRKSLTITARLAALAAIVFLTLVLALAFDARSRPDLQPWHTVSLQSEFTRRQANEVESLADYLAIEQRLFEELQEKVVAHTSGEPGVLNRYLPGSRSNPQRANGNFNRTSESRPVAPRGAVLMLHGMTDGPYSMRHLQQLFYRNGFYVLNLRLPAHGTTPGALARISWQDWIAAVELGARHVASEAGANQPYWIVGYSNGGALAIKHALDAIEKPDSRVPDRLVLLSPMIGVSPLARLSKWFTWIGEIGYFEKALWLDLLPEYDPHKYNSFPNNGPRQSRKLTRAIQQQMDRLDRHGLTGRLPPVLAFQSLVDATVSAQAVFEQFYARLPANGSELVVFDINRLGDLDQFVNPAANRLLGSLLQADLDRYALSLLVNSSSDTRRLAERHKPAGSLAISTRALDLAWPERFYSLSHIALPFPPDDPIYGYREPTTDSGFPWVGWISWLGEDGALALPASVYTRARSNPFYDYLELRIEEYIQGKERSLASP
jgi:alpha-beta hydrolase superfamily lysophospholipase